MGGPDDEERPGAVRAGDRPVDVGRDLGVPGTPERETALPRTVRHAAGTAPAGWVTASSSALSWVWLKYSFTLPETHTSAPGTTAALALVL